MRYFKSLFVFLTIGFGFVNCLAQDFYLNRGDLNRQIGETGLFLDLKISPILSEKFVTFMVLENETISRSDQLIKEQLKRQKVPDLVRWVIGDTKNPEIKWICGIITNRDLTYHTIVKLPSKEWYRSSLVFEFSKGKLASKNEKHVRIFLSLAEMDLEGKGEFQSHAQERNLDSK